LVGYAKAKAKDFCQGKRRKRTGKVAGPRSRPFVCIDNADAFIDGATKEATATIASDLLLIFLLDWFVHCEAVGSQPSFTIPSLFGLICAQRILTSRAWFRGYRRDCVADGFLIAALGASDVETVRRFFPGRKDSVHKNNAG
jgi:hypothetical protein